MPFFQKWIQLNKLKNDTYHSGKNNIKNNSQYFFKNLYEAQDLNSASGS